MENKELTHHGIKGMRWGVRRYQNPDGTLTAKGKKRYSAEMEKLKEEERVLKNKQRTQAKVDKLLKKRQELDDMKKKLSGKVDEDDSAKTNKTSTSAPNKPKSIKDLTDEELQARINRIRLEQTYKALTPEVPSAGEKFVNKVLKPAGSKLASKLGDTILDKVNKEIRSKFGMDVGEKELNALKKEFDTIDYKRKIAQAKADIKKAEGGGDTEYDRLKREADMAGFETRIRNNNKLKETASNTKSNDDAPSKTTITETTTSKSKEVSSAKSTGEKYVQMSIFDDDYNKAVADKGSDYIQMSIFDFDD